jgi:diguanylate cyclase (GGDEF)-like protein/PAS domain S-box-containing protein
MAEFLYANESFIRLSVFLGCFCLLGLWEVVSPIRTLTQPKSKRWFRNISLIVIGTILLRIMLPVAAVGTAYLAAEEHWGVLPHLDIPLWLKIVVAFILLDFFVYTQHMVFHVMPLMWRFHRVHHSDLDCDVTTGLRFHPVEIVVSMVFKMMLIVAIGAPALSVILFEIVLNFMSMFTHSNIKLNKTFERVMRWLFVTPDMHRIHHSVRENETNSNFGFHTSIWDRLFGTYVANPKDGQLGMTIGLDQFREPKWQKVSGLISIPFSTAIRGYAINYRDTYNADQLELARELAMRSQEKAQLATELTAYLNAIGQHALVSVTDLEGTIIDVNEKFCQVSGYSREELLGANHRIINSGFHSKEYFTGMWNAISRGVNWYGEFCNRAKNGDLYWVDSTIIPMMDEDGKISRYIAVRLDITDRKKNEEELQIAYESLARANSQLEQLSCIDGLTGISNRRHFDNVIQDEINKMRRMSSPLSLIICDIDYFKNFNDACGHLAGDDCLKKVANKIQSSFTRASDLVARYGGEEFVIILPDTNKDMATVLAERMRVGIEQLGIEHNASKVANVITVSVGLTTLVPDEGTTIPMLIGRADKALYTAKEKGRNTVEYL